MSNYAVFRVDGNQVIAQVGDKLKLQTLDAEVGETLTFDEVLALGIEKSEDGEAVEGNRQLGYPTIEGASVEVNVDNHGKDDKIRVVKFRRRQGSKTLQGHRQGFTQVTVTAINSK